MDLSSKPSYEILSSVDDLCPQLAPEETDFVSSLNIVNEEYEIYIQGVSGVFKVLRNRIGMLLATSFYDNLMLMMVLANTLIMSLNGIVDSDSVVVS